VLLALHPIGGVGAGVGSGVAGHIPPPHAQHIELGLKS